jgi:hypothetical protein
MLRFEGWEGQAHMNFDSTREGVWVPETTHAPQRRPRREIDALKALQCFRNASRSARWTRLLARLGAPQRTLVDLDDIARHATLTGSVSRGLQIVPVKAIRGSSGRSMDFDADFHPLNENTRDRWLSIATAVIRGDPLPPISLVQIADQYYVQDGNHRVSVYRAIGQDFADAEVVEWQLAAPPPGPETARAAVPAGLRQLLPNR